MKKLSRYLTALLLLVSLLGVTGGLMSCRGDDDVVSNTYCSLPAHFSYSPVSAVSQLYTACNAQGEWSTITAVNSQYIFANLTSSTPVNRTAINNYSAFYMGLCGFIVGLPTIPEIGSTTSVVTCFDLACSNCYQDYSVTRKLTLQSGGYASCSRCGRTYDLNNIGQVAAGDGGINLYRYHVYFGNNTLTISNN